MKPPNTSRQEKVSGQRWPRFKTEATEETPPSRVPFVGHERGGPVQAGMLRGMARAQKRHSQAVAMMVLDLSAEGLDLMRRRHLTGASPNLVGR